MAGPYGITQLSKEGVSAVTSTNTVELGTRAWYAGVEYVHVYNMSTSTIAVGMGVVTSAASAFSVTVSSVVYDTCFGVCRNVEVGPTQYFWACVRGKTEVQNVPDQAVGDLSAVTGAGIALADIGQFIGITTGATGYTFSHKNCGVLLESAATNSLGAAYVNCLG
jgi:hypothetical protein